MNSTSPSLLESLRQKDNQAAWRRFAQIYTPLLSHWARGLGMQAQSADDLVQEVFVVLVRKLPEYQYDPQQKFRSWLYTILLNKWKNWRVPRPGEQLLEGQELDEQAAPEMEVPSDQDYQRHVLEGIMQVVEKDFQPLTWQAFWEHAVRGRPGDEVARELGLTLAAVYSAKFRVLHRLRQERANYLD